MGTRVQLQELLERLLGSNHVYYQAPSSISMAYPAIKYSKVNITSKYANSTPYSHSTRYELIVIDSRPDNSVIRQLLDLPMTRYERHYKADNLNHDVISIYY